MKKLLMVIIILSHLGLGFAFAWDTHPQAIAGHNPLLSAMNLDIDSHPSEQCSDANHCCHGIAHLLSLMNQSDFAVLTAQPQRFLTYREIAKRLSIPPLFKPPIV
jgi:hypothetical protein